MAGRSSPTTTPLRQLQDFHFGVDGGSAGVLDQPGSVVPLWQPTTERQTASGSSLRLLLERAGVAYSEAWQRWRQEAASVVAALEPMVVTGGGAAQGSALGAMGSRFLDAGALAERVRSQDREQITGARRRRLESTLSVLQRGLEGRMTRRPLILYEPVLELLTADLPDGVDAQPETAPCSPMVAAFEQHAGQVAELIAALRVARLELEQAYDPVVHDPAVERFDWRSLHDAERPLLPSLICVVSYTSAVGEQLSPLLELLGSARPIQILVPVDPLTNALDGALDLAHLALSHRRCFVHQGSLADAEALEGGFDRGLVTPGGSLHLIAGDDHSDNAAAAIDSRCHPLFVFDPGRSRAGGALDLAGNPDPQTDWLGADDPFTVAELALLSSNGIGELARIDPDLSSEVLMPLSDWLALTAEQTRHRLPFIVATTEQGEPVRLAVSRRLALACVERLDHWRTLRRLADRAPDRDTLVELPSEKRPLVPEDDSTDDTALQLETERQQMAEQVVRRLMSQLLSEATSP